MAVLPRWLLLALTGLAITTLVPLGQAPVAWAQDDEDEDEDEDEDSEEEEEEEEDGEEGEDEDQPPVTAGGLYNMKTWPTAENLRPLTLNRGMLEVQAGFNMDLSALDAFETWRIPITAKYGLRDHLELQFGYDFLLVTTRSKFDEFEQFGSRNPKLDAMVATFALESALYYDFVDFRLALDFPINPSVEGLPAPDCDTIAQEAPCGLTPPVPFTIDIVVGFPFRWAPKKQFAIIGLDKLFTVHTIGGGKPDLTTSIGFAIQPLDFLVVFLRAELIVPEFNTNFLFIPANAAVQFSPNNRFDIGLQFGFNNIKPTLNDQEAEPPIGPFDRRFLLLYLQARF
jgi:hypothetical protein